MILAAHRELALERAGRFCEGAIKISALNVVRFGVKTFLIDRILNCEDRLEQFVFDHNFLRGGATRLLRLAHNHGDDLAVIRNFFVREQDLVVTHCADII